MRTRKGTEKPIEIFVALFIILAVALVMLKIFQNQISQSTTELANTKQEEANKELLQKVQIACGDKCTAASNNGCSLASLASLCTYNSLNVLGSEKFVDLNNDKKEGYDATYLAGVGVCEDRLYCFHILSGGCCARSITPAACKEILNNYWKDKGFDLATRKNMLNTTLSTSPIYAGDATTCPVTATRWDQLAEWNSVVIS